MLREGVLCPFTGRQYGIFYPHEENVSKAYFHFPSRESGSGFEF